MVVIFETFDPIAADILKTNLIEVGIDAHVLTPDIGGSRPSLSFVMPIKVFVQIAQVENAKKVLKDLDLAVQK